MPGAKERLKDAEELYLQIFKITLIVALSVALVASLVLVVIGAKGVLFSSAARPEPAQVAQPPKMDMQGFVQAFAAAENPVVQPAAVPKSVSPKKKIKPTPVPAQSSDPAMEKIWGYADQYQQKCGLLVQWDREKFLKKIKVGTDVSRYRSADFLDSQDAFIKGLLEDPAVIELGKSQTVVVVSKLVCAALNWHAKEWRRQVEAGRQFEAREALRVERFNRTEELRVAGEESTGKDMLHAALWAFGVFLTLALLLIFAKIETNLREIKLEIGARRG